MSDGTPAAGVKVTFYDDFVPSLKSGQYTLTVSQTLVENVTQTSKDGGRGVPRTTVGTTARDLSGVTVSIVLAAPGATTAIPVGASLAVLTADLKSSAVVVVAAAVPTGSTVVDIQPHTFTTDFPAGSVLALSSPQDHTASQTFIVRGPRFVLDPSDVHQVFPPAGGAGVYDQFLPMIVLNKRSLPWERPLSPSLAKLPWVALVVFTADELLAPAPASGPPPPPPPPNSQANPTGTASVPLAQLVKPPAGTLGPTLVLEDDEDPDKTYCNVIEISTSSFAGLVPTAEDLPFLAHVRQVVTTDKVPLNTVHDGWFSCVVANRFAVAPPASGAPLRNVVHLVSLEGFESYLTSDPPAPPPGYDRVRLVSLYSWTFDCTPEPLQDFRQLMLNLISAASDQGTDLPLRVPVGGGAIDTTGATPEPATTAATRLLDGYVPLSYTTVTGEQTFAWYRGPLAPVVTTPFLESTGPDAPENPDVPMNPAEAMIYDPASGLFDHSYAVAFQTGRSLALASLPFATNLLQWRREAHALVDLLLEYLRSPVLAAILQSKGILDAGGNLTETGITDLAELLRAKIVPNALVDYLATEFADGIAQKIGPAGGFSQQDTVVQPSNPPTVLPVLPADLSALMQEPDVVSLLRQLSGLETGDGQRFEPAILPEQIVTWLAQASLLYGVPFNNLVADSRMLPCESIRFFYVDPNWVDSLLDGALSVGLQSSRDSLFHQLMRDALHSAADAAVGEVRNRFLGVTGPTAPPPPGPTAGFLLRSAAVAAWPGLEVRAWAASDAENAMRPLRLDRVAPTVMLAIFPEIPVKVEVSEPSEGLVFGYEDEGVALRYVPGAQGATADNLGQVVDPDQPHWLAPTAIQAARRPALATGPGPLQIAGNAGLAHAIQSLFPSPAPALTAASLAVEMVKVPEQMLFVPQAGAGA